MGIIETVVSLSAQTQLVALEAAEETERLFGLDYQTLFDTAVTMVSVFILFIFLTNVLIKPVNKLLAERRARLEEQGNKTRSDMEEVEKLKAQYQQRIDEANREADSILAEARKTSLKQGQAVLDEAKESAARIIAAARQEAADDKKLAENSVRSEIRDVASVMASQLVTQKIDTTISDALLNETLKEVGDVTC